QNGIHIGAVSNFTQFTAVCFFKCDDTSLNGLLFDCYSSASAFANNGFGIRTMSNQLQIILRKNGSNTQHNIAFTDTSSWHCLQVKLYTSSTTFRAVVKLDGVRVLEDLDTGIDTPVNEMRLGTDKNNSNNLSFDGLVTDWIFWKRATTRSEDAAIHGYFNKRYGTTFTLDNTDIAFNGFQAVDALTGRFNGLDVIERQDGKYNLVFSDLDGNIFFAEQGASLSSWTITKIVSDTLEIQSLKVWGRIEGRLVLVTAHKDSEEADDDTGKIMVHVADTIDDDGTYTSVSILTGRAYPQSLMLLNVDNDYNINPSGAKQLLLYSYQGTMSGHGGIRFLEFTGDDITDPSDWTETTIITHESAWWLAGFYDMDNSGVKSLVYSARNNRNSASVPGIYYIKPNGDIRNAWTRTTIVSTNADWLHVDVGNFFGNSSDVASIRSNTSTIYLFNK